MTVNAAGTVADGRVVIDGQVISFGKGEVAVDELEWWRDPKNGMQIPVRWHINMNSQNGVLDTKVDFGARSFMGFQWHTGYSMQYCMVGHSNGGFFLPDGRYMPIQDIRTYVEWGRIVMPLLP